MQLDAVEDAAEVVFVIDVATPDLGEDLAETWKSGAQRQRGRQGGDYFLEDLAVH